MTPAIPAEILQRILLSLAPLDLYRVMQTHSRSVAQSAEEQLWKRVTTLAAFVHLLPKAAWARHVVHNSDSQRVIHYASRLSFRV